MKGRKQGGLLLRLYAKLVESQGKWTPDYI